MLDKIPRLLGVEWLRREEASATAPSAQGATDGGHLVPPPAEELALLATLADKGLLNRILQEAERMRERDPRLGPWIEQLATFARGYETRKLRTFLQAYGRGADGKGGHEDR